MSLEPPFFCPSSTCPCVDHNPVDDCDCCAYDQLERKRAMMVEERRKKQQTIESRCKTYVDENQAVLNELTTRAKMVMEQFKQVEKELINAVAMARDKVDESIDACDVFPFLLDGSPFEVEE